MHKKDLLVTIQDKQGKVYIQEVPGLNRYPKNIIDAKELTEYCVYRLKHKFKKLGFFSVKS